MAELFRDPSWGEEISRLYEILSDLIRDLEDIDLIRLWFETFSGSQRLEDRNDIDFYKRIGDLRFKAHELLEAENV